MISILLCVIAIFSKYTWLVSLKDKKNITVTNDFRKVLVESNCKSNEILDEKESEFFSRPVKS